MPVKAHNIEMSSTAADDAPDAGGIGGKASAEQLMEFVKKQKVKIKKLIAENEALKSAAQTASLAVGNLDSDNVSPSPSSSAPSSSSAHPRNVSAALIRCVLLHLDTLSARHGRNKDTDAGRVLDTSSAFKQWCLITRMSRAEDVTKELAQCRASNATMEQRITKLKALLARTHQANQRNLEEFDFLRKAKETAESDLKAMELKTKAELNSLREVVRSSSITSAFQYDIDILIQNAAGSLVARQHQQSSSASVTAADASSTIKDLEDELMRMRIVMNDMMAKEAASDSEIESALIKYEAAQRDMRSLQDRVEHLSKTLAKRDAELHDQSCLRKELELELSGVLVDRNGLLIDRRRSQELETHLLESKQILELSEKKRKQLEITTDRLTQENAVLNVKCQDFLKIQSENTRLNLLVNDFKSRHAEDIVTKRHSDNFEVPKDSMRDLVENVRHLENALKASTSAAVSEFDAINLKQKMLSSIARAHGSISCILSLIRVGLVSFAATFTSEYDLIDTQRFDRDPLDGLLAFTESLMRYLQDLNDKKSTLESEMSSLRSSSMLEMSWEASSYTISPRDTLTLPLYGSAGLLRITLTWTFTCALSDYLGMSVVYQHPKNGKQTIQLVSKTSTVDGVSVLSGSLLISEEHGDLSLIISNNSIWANAVIAYHFGLVRESAESNERIQSLACESKCFDSKILKASLLIQRIDAFFRRVEKLERNFDMVLRKIAGYSNNTVDRNGLLSFLYDKILSHSLHLSRVIGLISAQNESNKIDLGTDIKVDSFDDIDSSARAQQMQPRKSINVLSSSSGVVTYSAEGVSIRASGDLRLTLPPIVGRVRISWSVQVKKGTIGFTLGKLLPNKEVPLIIPYVRSVEKSREPIVGYKTFEFESITSIVVFFDNTFSWLTPKLLKYCITVECFSDSTSVSDTLDASYRSRLAIENIEEVDHSTSDDSDNAENLSHAATSYSIANLEVESEVKECLNFFDIESPILVNDVVEILKLVA